MKKILVLLVMPIIFSSCFGVKNALPFKNFDSAIISRPDNFYLADSLPSYKLTHKDLRAAESIVKIAFKKEVVAYRNSESANAGLKEYGRQYFGYKNAKGQRCVFVQCIYKTELSHNTYWRKTCFWMDDGGDTVFRVWANLDAGSYDDFSTNYWA